MITPFCVVATLSVYIFLKQLQSCVLFKDLTLHSTFFEWYY